MKEIYPQGEVCKLINNPIPLYKANANEKIRMHTLDCFGNRLRPNGDFRALAKEVANPVTGPVEIAGAKAGDILRITIEDIQCGSIGFASCGSGFGVLAGEAWQDTQVFYEIKDGLITGSNLNRVPVQPVIGTIGTWPEKGEPLTVAPSYYGGNLDTLDITKGSIIYLPVNVDGGMFFLGDLHALQGAGEMHGGGLECAGVIDVSFSVISDFKLPTPLVETSREIMTIASDINFDKAMQKASQKMVAIVQQINELSREDALLYCSLLGHLRIGQVVNPGKTAVFALERQYLKREIC